MEKNKKTISTKKTNKKSNSATKQKSCMVKTKKNNVKQNLLDDKNYKLAEKYLKNNDFYNAYKEYLKLSEIYPKNKKIYKRLIESLTHNYTYKENSRDFKTSLDDYITTYKILATKKEIKFFENKMLDYKQVKVKETKSKFLLITFLGFLGIHKFLEKKYITGIIYLFTLGLFGIGVILDLINDYAEYEDDKKLDIVRYIISLMMLLVGVLRINTTNYYYFIIASILFTPIIYSKLLRLIPNLIKFIALIALIYLGFKVAPVIDYVPNNVIGTWTTENENTNYESILISKDKTTIKFDDREEQIGDNEYDNTNKTLKVKVSATNIYKFRIDIEKNEICTYNDANTCIISFKMPFEDK